MISIKLVLSLSDVTAKSIIFPQNFKWCISSSAHQIEGGNYNSDWWEFEQKSGNILDGDTSKKATDHWNRVQEDVFLMKDLGISTYRFSVEWAKIEPFEGSFDQSVLDHYREEVQILRREGIEPIVTLLHYTLPQWLAKKGGLHGKSFPGHFAKYTKKVYESLGDVVDMWVTFNELLGPVAKGYLKDDWPPQDEGRDEKDKLNRALDAIKNSLSAHALSYHSLHALAATAKRKVSVGMIHALATIRPVYQIIPPHLLLLNLLGAHFFARSYNWNLLHALKSGILQWNIPSVLSYYEFVPLLQNSLDFIGINYYSRHNIRLNLFSPTLDDMFQIVYKGEIDDMGWEAYPQGITRLLLKVQKIFPGLPIYITENGIADNSDEKRIDYIKEHLKAIHRAINKGVEVKGYCYWTLVDNFEWNYGYTMKYGLYALDPETMSRTPKKSAEEFKKIINSNGFID